MDANMTIFLAWLALAGGLLLGAMGTVIPGLPGAAMVVAGALVHKWLLPGVLSWWTVGFLAGLAVISWIVDLMGGVMGARLGGATKAGLIGAAIGGALGLLFGLPGLILGPFFGAIVGDLYAKRTNVLALMRSGSGAALGFLISLVMRILLLIAMAVAILVDIVF